MIRNYQYEKKPTAIRRVVPRRVRIAGAHRRDWRPVQMIEAYGSGKVSPAARKRYLAAHESFPRDAFTRIAGGYRMRGYESQIVMARAMGRGWHTGGGEPIHPFDVAGPAEERLRGKW
ncbi:hypothetical protein CL86_gp078 [Mycobacterium phage SkiPole]|uniref:Uncharacterized protein n=1 Tax=Mycobacterium phage SkiPole TaxID=701456 RepID=D2XRS2_9CAUD|nr:hypothetical protein CL86_gp078 [Mycobacterium phage SkiPole]ADA83823.1 hypothetical protein SKIPOLE_78 [Mycobacterium phage SkiPole]